MNSLRLLAASLLLAATGVLAAEPVPLLHAHAHNDYEHTRPLLDALDHGFGSIEADVHLVDGQLLVAHDRKSVQPDRTLETLYLDPLRERINKNGGRAYRDGPTITLLIDVKSAAEPTYAALHATLKNYPAMLTVFRDGGTEIGAVTVIISGNRAPAAMAAQPLRYAAMDGRIEDLAGTTTPAQVPWISENWQKVFKWRWSGPLPESDRIKLLQFVKQAHAQGRRIRFWNTPDTPAAWQLLSDHGVDLINTDDLDGLQAFFRAQPATAKKQ